MLSVVVLTHNDQDLIKTCLESVKWADELVVIDNNSTDSTREIVKTYTDKVFIDRGNDFAIRRNLGMEKARGDWVLYLDSDERVSEPLKKEILSIIESTEQSAFALSRKNIIFGKLVSYGPYKKDWMIRLFKKSDFEGWQGRIHEYGKFKGKLGYAKNSLLHLTHRDIDHIVLKSLDWSNIDAKLRLEAHHPPMTSLRFLRILMTETFNQGIKRGGFFAGTVGVMDSMLQVFSLFITYVRLWQLQQPKSPAEVYEQIDKKLIQDNFNY